MGKDLKGHNLGKGISQRQDKYYVARFTSVSGERMSKLFSNVNEAKLWLRDASYDDAHSDIEQKAVKKRKNKNQDITVDAWFDYWLNQVLSSRIKYSTRRSYRNRYDYRIKPIIGYMLLNDIKPMNCQAVLNYCMEKKDVSGSISKIRSIMKKMFEFAVENEMMTNNPITKNVQYKKQKPAEKRVFTVSEQKQFKELATKSTYKDVFIFILNTGLRIGELSALKWSRVDFEKKNIFIDATAYFDEDTKTVEENTPKSEAGFRYVPFTNESEEILRRLYEKRDKDKPYVFYNKDGERIIENNAYNALQKIVKNKMHIEESFSLHSLRHTFATRCVESGMNPKALQKILGHENIATTMNLYVHATEEELNSEMSKLNGKF